MSSRATQRVRWRLSRWWLAIVPFIAVALVASYFAQKSRDVAQGNAIEAVVRDREIQLAKVELVPVDSVDLDRLRSIFASAHLCDGRLTGSDQAHEVFATIEPRKAPPSLVASVREEVLPFAAEFTFYRFLNPSAADYLEFRKGRGDVLLSADELRSRVGPVFSSLVGHSPPPALSSVEFFESMWEKERDAVKLRIDRVRFVGASPGTVCFAVSRFERGESVLVFPMLSTAEIHAEGWQSTQTAHASSCYPRPYLDTLGGDPKLRPAVDVAVVGIIVETGPEQRIAVRMTFIRETKPGTKWGLESVGFGVGNGVSIPASMF